MSELATAALVMLSVWTGALTLILILIVRQIGVLTVRLSLPSERFSVEDDGPEIGSTIPVEVFNKLPAFDDRFCIMLISSNCAPCRELVLEIKGHKFNSNIVVLLTGPKEKTDPLADLLPSNFWIVRDPEARQIATDLQIRSTPFAIITRNGMVKQKAYLYSIRDLLSLINGHEDTLKLTNQAP